MKRHTPGEHKPRFFLFRWGQGFANAFNSGFNKMSGGYARGVTGIVRHRVVMLMIYAGLVAATVFMFRTVPPGFIPPLDRGYWRLYFDHVLQADQGADLDFLVGGSGAFVPRDNH